MQEIPICTTKEFRLVFTEIRLQGQPPNVTNIQTHYTIIDKYSMCFLFYFNSFLPIFFSQLGTYDHISLYGWMKETSRHTNTQTLNGSYDNRKYYGRLLQRQRKYQQAVISNRHPNCMLQRPSREPICCSIHLYIYTLYILKYIYSPVLPQQYHSLEISLPPFPANNKDTIFQHILTIFCP